ncbi:DUF2000 domain-containing protein [Schinkia azotoformans]|uniref:DUF2000 domain-containing protein n=1 Tax=Schinkia azotoformans TaxID=1454 RepID=UPI002DB80289|nr:DUF2000 domain-containing protein [Schinkia azotoformans]MEC1720058.1 DUF2000 domain-containing protein [Schinkia azotoformans]MED4414226.1 DUF2000 domain-containing protein [Schinkia azotoformans]
MSQQNNETKCVLLIDSELPLGLLANTAAVLALTIGKRVEGIIGSDVVDGSGQIHTGITTIPLPILKSTQEGLQVLKQKVSTEAFQDLLVVDFTNAAQTTKTYEAYTQKIATFTSGDLYYLGIALYGDRKKINKLTGNLSLLR